MNRRDDFYRGYAKRAKGQARAQTADACAPTIVATSATDYDALEREALIEMDIDPMLDDVGCK